jgi:CheY-like chemotaxis protein
VQQAAHIIDRQVDHLTRLVEDLLDVSRINQGKISLHLQPVELGAVLTTAIETAHPLIRAQDHTLHVQPADAPVWVRGDAVRLSQVFSNLLHNAAKFTPPPGRIDIETRPLPDGSVEVSVSDNGSGIDADMLPRIFDLFIQGDQALDRAKGGLGIGLSLVRRIVALHGGHVHAESGGPSTGSRFTISLPLISSPIAMPDTPSTQPASDSLRILIVDDNVDSVESLAMLLESYGHTVYTAGDGEHALREVQARSLDLVVLDIGLPGMSGYDVARALRALALPRQPTLVALSGYGRDADRSQARDAGFDHHLVKPADPEQLFEIMATVPAGVASATS